MKRLLFLLLFLPLYATAQNTTYITIDSLPNNLNTGWRFYGGDAPAMARPDFPDSAWKPVNAYIGAMVKSGKDSKAYNGIGWYRFHFRTDSSLAGKPMAMIMEQSGASELYLDGEKLKSYGTIGNKLTTVYYTPQQPFIFAMPAGNHVLALRYANYETSDDDLHFSNGFNIMLYPANGAVMQAFQNLEVLAVLLFFLFGIFLAIGILHLLLFLFQPRIISNAYFSFFTLTLAFAFLSIFIRQKSTNPDTSFYWAMSLFPLLVIAFAALSGFMNTLFSSRRIRFYIIAASGLLVALVPLVNYEAGLLALLGYIAVVAIEALIIITIAIFRRKRGALIIGAGMLLFVLLAIYTLYIVTFQGDFNIDNNTTSGTIAELVILTAILGIPISFSAYQAWSFAALNRNLKAQLTQVEVLSQKTLAQEAEKQHLLETRQEELEREVAQRTAALTAEKKKSDDLLLNILPEEVAEELKEKGSAEARLYNEVSVLFTDFVDFTRVSETLSPAALVAEIHHCFKAFDEIITTHGLEKIKTIGDAYMAVAGLPAANPDHATAMVAAALDIRNFMLQRHQEHSGTFAVRIGIHSGPVVAGIVGIKKFAYDIWGDTVNTAARMEQHGERGKVNISAATHTLVQQHFSCTYRGEIEAKHKGRLAMYFAEAK